MRPTDLYHGTRNRICDTHLRPHTASDTTQKENCQRAVYATDRKDIALGMSLTGDPGTKSMGDYEKKPYQTAFVEGKPAPGKRYLYTVDGRSFTESPPGSHQWTSKEPMKILKEETFETEELKVYWRVATEEEKD